MRLRAGALVLGLVLALAGCGTEDDAGSPQWRLKVLQTYPHDTAAFTQGLELRDDVLYESTGRYRRSDVRTVDVATGKPIRQVQLPDAQFAEGLTLAGDTLWQLTWRQGVAYARDPRTLDARRTVRYRGEGWGLCHDEDRGRGRDRLVMSDGSDRLTFRDPSTFAKRGDVGVTEDGRSLEGINELECTEGGLWANVFPTTRLVRIDPSTGRVTASADTSELPPPPENEEAVANGITAVPGTRDEFLITGKLWPHLYRVRLTPPEASPDASS